MDEFDEEDDEFDYDALPPASAPSSSSSRRTLRARNFAPSYEEEEEPLDEYSFVEPEWWISEKAQPYRIVIDPLVPIILDIHSHLMHTEVIGLIGGVWDEKAKLLRILSAHPCRTLTTGNDHVNVELDPVSQIEVTENISALKQITVGWYHRSGRTTSNTSRNKLSRSAFMSDDSAFSLVYCLLHLSHPRSQSSCVS